MNNCSNLVPAIEIIGLRKVFGRKAVLNGLFLKVGWGEILTVMGSNGSGKTTLINILSTLMRPDEGRINVAGLDLSRMGRSIRRIIGVVTHEPLMYGDLTGYENLKFAGRLFGLDNVDDRVASVTKRLEITAYLDYRANTLSHGLQKRFSIARALLHEPQVLIMDEPENGLDQNARDILDSVIEEKKNSFGAVLTTTHNLQRGLAMGGRLMVLKHGGIVYHDAH